jgi:hypothetical protein
LRSPIVDGHALLVPLRLRDPRGAFSIDNLEAEGSKAIRLSLGGIGVRGEFHSMRERDVSVVAGGLGSGWFPSLDAAVLVDRTGELSRHASALVGGTPARGGAALVEGLALNLLNMMEHWPPPSRPLEGERSTAAYRES